MKKRENKNLHRVRRQSAVRNIEFFRSNYQARSPCHIIMWLLLLTLSHNWPCATISLLLKCVLRIYKVDNHHQ